MKKAISISFALIIFLFAAAERSLACSCVITPEPLKKQIQQAYSGTEAVFSGEVLEIKESAMNKNDLTIKFKVAKSWKGQIMNHEVTISTAKDSAMCGYIFEKGKTYLVYASGKSDDLQTTNCSRTAMLGKKSDAKYLDKLKRKKPSSN